MKKATYSLSLDPRDSSATIQVSDLLNSIITRAQIILLWGPNQNKWIMWFCWGQSPKKTKLFLVSDTIGSIWQTAKLKTPWTEITGETGGHTVRMKLGRGPPAAPQTRCRQSNNSIPKTEVTRTGSVAGSNNLAGRQGMCIHRVKPIQSGAGTGQDWGREQQGRKVRWRAEKAGTENPGIKDFF